MADYSDARHGRSEYSEGIATLEHRPSSMREPKTVGGQLTYLVEMLQTQDELIKVLEERLSPLLVPELDSKDGDRGEPEDALRTQSDLADNIESYARRAVRHNRRLQRLLERINL